MLDLVNINNESLSISVVEQEVEKYGLSNSIGLSFRGIYNGKMGYSYTEKLDEESVTMLIDSAKECAILVEGEDEEFIYDGSGEYLVSNCYDENTANFPASEQIRLALELDKKAKELDKDILKVAQSSFSVMKGEVAIINSEGVDLYNKSTISYCGTYAIAKDGNDMVTDGDGEIKFSIDKIDINEIAKNAVKKTLGKRGASSVKSGQYKVVLSNDMMGSLLGVMESNFYGDIAQQGKSLLKGKVGEFIASNKVNLIDSPEIPGVGITRGFDDEGVPTRTKYVIENGIFKGFLHNLKTAKKDGVETTGNASKASFKSPVKVSSLNLYIENGTKTVDEIFAEVNNGIYITALEGMHAGANSITGDFSLAAQGKLIENGQLTRGVKQITVAGNFFELLKNIEDIANDLKYDGGTSSPSVVVRELSIAGE